jgi:hypothetical protein
MPGDAFSFQGYTAPTADTWGGVGNIVQGTAIIDQIVINWNWETGAILQYTANFSANGSLNWTGSGSYTDATDPEAPSVLDVLCPALSPGSGSGGGSLGDIASASLTITADNQPYVNCNTAGWTRRKMGPVDWTLAMVFDDDDPISNFAINNLEEILLYVDDTDYWTLKWGITRDFTNLTVDRETGAIIRYTANFDMAGYNENDAEGEVLRPGDVAWWPLT